MQFTSRSFAASSGVAALLAAGCGLASATEFGTVTAVSPATAQVAGSQRQCWQQQHLVAQPTTGGGAVAGAVVGGAIGHGIGGGPVGTIAGVLIGSAVGNDVEASGTPPAAYTTTRCRRVATTQQQPAYDVQYDYNGQHYSVRMAQAPAVGSQLPLDVTAQGALPPAQVAQGQPQQYPGVQAPVDAAPVVDGTVVTEPPVRYVYPAYGYGYGYPAVTVGIAPRVWIGGGWGWGWGWRGRWH